MPIATAVKVEGGLIALVPADATALPPVGARVMQRLDWARRHRHMRVHTALHLLSVVIPLPVTGGQIGADRGRLDFDMPDPPGDLAEIEARLNALRSPFRSAEKFWVEEIIDLRSTRKHLVDFVHLAEPLRTPGKVSFSMRP